MTKLIPASAIQKASRLLASLRSLDDDLDLLNRPIRGLTFEVHVEGKAAACYYVIEPPDYHNALAIVRFRIDKSRRRIIDELAALGVDATAQEDSQ